GSAFAVSVSFVLGGKLPLHVCPLHVTPAGVELTVPVPWSVAVKAWLSLGGAGGAAVALGSGGSSPSSFEGLGSEPAFGELHPSRCNSRLAKIAILAQRSTIFETPAAVVQRQCRNRITPKCLELSPAVRHRPSRGLVKRFHQVGP